MPNPQLVDYIKQQIQGGVSKDAIRKALVDAGWPEADVSESLSSVAFPVATMPAAVSTVQPVIKESAKPMASTVNLSSAMGGASGASSEIRPSEPVLGSTRAVTTAEEGHKGLMPMIIMGSIIVILLAALGYVYFSLSGKLAAGLPGTVDDTELVALRAEVKNLGDAKAASDTQLAAANAENEKFKAEASFFAVPVSGSLAQDIEGKIQGVLSGGGTMPYTVTTAHGLRVYVKNWKDAKVDAVLKPLLGATVEISGTHKPASPDLTVTAVNGALVNPPPPAATSTTP